ncbi:MAG TPA: efflux RND transporter periplasmic adaptor subunit [Steroidobacteraceae bacterium]|nr:efflux RND transporter periplasmic adaptor subunit [Steroidobacteraceae bacterium]
MGTSPEHLSHSGDEQIAWIGRDRAGFERPGTADATAKPASPIRLPADPRTRWIAVGVGILAVLGAITWATHRGGPAHVALADRQNIPLISVVTPGLRSVTSSVTFTGGIFARYDMPIGNDGDTGRIVAVYVEAGDHVQKGQILARIDESVLVPQVNRLEASLEQAQAQAALSAAEYKRALGVQAAGALSAEDIEKRRATAVTDGANVKVVAAQLAEARARLARTRIIAPIAGTVLARRAEVGMIASPGGDSLFRVASGGEVEMRGQLAEQDLAQVKVGDPAMVRLTGLSQSFEGKVRLLGAIIDPTTRLGEIRIALKPDAALRPGAFARGTVAVGNAQRPVVPQTAVLTDSQGSYVFVVNAQDHAERRAVHVADTSDAGFVIGSGLTGSERVVVTAGGFLHDGEAVKVAPPGKPAG